MNKLLAILCLTLFISASLAKKSATDQAAETAAQLKDKVVEKVCFVFSKTNIALKFIFDLLGKRCS